MWWNPIIINYIGHIAQQFLTDPLFNPEFKNGKLKKALNYNLIRKVTAFVDYILFMKRRRNKYTETNKTNQKNCFGADEKGQ